MVAYQGDVDFAYEGSGGLGKMFKKAFTGEGMSLMKVSGSGDVFLAQDADQVFVLHLEDEGVTVNGANVLAFESSLTWDINRVEGASMLVPGAHLREVFIRGQLVPSHHLAQPRELLVRPHGDRHPAVIAPTTVGVVRCDLWFARAVARRTAGGEIAAAVDGVVQHLRAGEHHAGYQP